MPKRTLEQLKHAKVAKVMHEYKHHEKMANGKTPESRAQAIAIGLSEARQMMKKRKKHH